jgi:NhaP-type Na+/H+ or K+/H+ antiporter
MEETWRQIDAVATPLLAYTLAAALGGSGFIAAFVAGIMFRLVDRRHLDRGPVGLRPRPARRAGCHPLR